MSIDPKQEPHFTSSKLLQDIAIGMADGLTVPFALAAGISGAVESIHIVVIAGLAEIAAGAISMGLGGYLAARTYADQYVNERKRELYEIDNLNEVERQETREIFQAYNIKPEIVEQLVQDFTLHKQEWADFMMRYELNMEVPEPQRALISATTIGSSYVVGGLIPLAPYMLLNDIKQALMMSVVSTLIALGVFGYIKGKLTGMKAITSALQTVIIGGLAAGVAYALASYISQ